MVESGNDALQVRCPGLRFCERSDRQQDKLRYFILHNTTCAARILSSLFVPLSFLKFHFVFPMWMEVLTAILQRYFRFGYLVPVDEKSDHGS